MDRADCIVAGAGCGAAGFLGGLVWLRVVGWSFSSGVSSLLGRFATSASSGSSGPRGRTSKELFHLHAEFVDDFDADGSDRGPPQKMYVK